MPKQTADAVVIGGGIYGAAATYFLSQTLSRVIVVERDTIAAGASGWAYGGLSPLSGHGIPGPMAELAQYAFGLHKNLKLQLEPSAAKALKYRNVVSVEVAFTENELEDLQTKHDWISQRPGFTTHLLSANDTRKLDARLSEQVIGANFVDGSMQVDPFSLTNWLIETSNADVIRANCEGIQTHNGKLAGIELSNGVQISTPIGILATGPWSTQDIGGIQPSNAVYPLKGEILRLQCSENDIEYTFGWQGNYTCTKPDGLVWAGTTEVLSDFECSPTESGRAHILQNLATLMPGLEIQSVVKHTACLRPMTRDGLALVGSLPQTDGLFAANGGGRKGILYSLGIGKIVSDLALGVEPDIDISNFLPKRLSLS